MTADSSPSTHKNCSGIIRIYQNVRNPASAKNVVSEIADGLRRIDWTNERGGGVGIVDAVQTYPEEAIAAAIEFAGANVESTRT